VIRIYLELDYPRISFSQAIPRPVFTMAPHVDDPIMEEVERMPAPLRPSVSVNPPRLVIIGAGSRGTTYARCLEESTNGVCVGVVEPIASKRQKLGRKFIWGENESSEGQEFEDWRQFVEWELERRAKEARGEQVVPGVDGVFICVQDEMHKDVIVGLAPLGIHIMCEKPLATTLDDCISIYKSLLSDGAPTKIFSIGHVLRYSQHNMLLRKLILEDRVIGDVMSINHTEPVGWWHFTHSYVRGNWRKESTSAPSLLTKSCHDIDMLLWLLSSPPPGSKKPPHLPSTVSSSGALQYFKRERKPPAAGSATNCFSCAYEPSCKFSAKKVYLGSSLKGLGTGNTDWPINIVLPEIEDMISKHGQDAGAAALQARLEEDYDASTPESEIEKKNWFGRCVYEADNDVNDDQVVTMTWDADPIAHDTEDSIQALAGRGSKIATLHMVAFTTKICDRYSNIYGTDGEIYADSFSIVVDNFTTGIKQTFYPHVEGKSHGGGDRGLARQFVLAIDRVKNHGQDVASAQQEYIGCPLEEVIRSHAMVFAAEEARRKKIVLDFPSWWTQEVDSRMR
jgi:predicted dehydrogenase